MQTLQVLQLTDATAEQLAPPLSYNDGTCNADLPNDSVYTRFLYTIRYLAANGFYVVLDNQLNTDPTAVNNPTVRPSGAALSWPAVCCAELQKHLPASCRAYAMLALVQHAVPRLKLCYTVLPSQLPMLSRA